MTQETLDPPVAEPAAAVPHAIVLGTPLLKLPEDLYIPPDALEIFLEAFEGPLDLLLYLIRRQNLDILDIPIAEITRQYVDYIELMSDLRLELAAEYLVMAAMLAEIKSRMLLPRPMEEEGDEEDPRAELVRRLQEYERFKQAAENLNNMPQLGRDIFEAMAAVPALDIERPQPQVELREILLALRDVMQRAANFTHHHVQLEPLSVRERMSIVLSAVRPDSYIDFTRLFDVQEGRMGVVVTLLAILELVKESLIELVQNEMYGPIYVKAAHHEHEPTAAEENP